MQNNPEIVKRAKRYLRRYNIWYCVADVCLYFIFFLVYRFLWRNTIVLLLVSLALILIMRRLGTIIFRKCFMSVLHEKLDADTFLEMLHQIKFISSSVFWQIYAEYYCGHYQNVVSICKIKLNEPKNAKRYRYEYLAFLSWVYFDIGDDENLRKVCEQYEAALANEKPSRKKKILFQSSWRFYDLYFKQDIEACEASLNKPAPCKLTEYSRIFRKARLALMKGNSEEARGYYETLAKEVPQLNIGKLSMKKLVEMGYREGEDFSEMFDISDEPTQVTIYAPTRRKYLKIVLSSIIVLLLFSLMMWVVYHQEEKVNQENICVLVEEDYDNVEMLDVFLLKNGKEIIDEMFICKTDTDIMVGCVYVYNDQPELYYDIVISIPISSLLEDKSPLCRVTFESTTTYNQVESFFFADESYKSREYSHVSEFEINGQKLYFVVTKINSISLFTT